MLDEATFPQLGLFAVILFLISKRRCLRCPKSEIAVTRSQPFPVWGDQLRQSSTNARGDTLSAEREEQDGVERGGDQCHCVPVPVPVPILTPLPHPACPWGCPQQPSPGQQSSRVKGPRPPPSRGCWGHWAWSPMTGPCGTDWGWRPERVLGEGPPPSLGNLAHVWGPPAPCSPRPAPSSPLHSSCPGALGASARTSPSTALNFPQ